MRRHRARTASGLPGRDATGCLLASDAAHFNRNDTEPVLSRPRSARFRASRRILNRPAIIRGPIDGPTMKLRLHNTLTRRVEDFVPVDPARVTMYVCGPTVYNYIHIGNARPAVVFGLLARLLRRHYPRRLRPQHHRRRRQDQRRGEGGRCADRQPSRRGMPRRTTTTWPGSASTCPTSYPHATAPIAEIIAMCERLIASGHAYAAEDHVLFDVASFRRLRQAVRPLDRGHDRRRAHRGRAVQEGRRPISCCGNPRPTTFPAGTAPGAAVGRAGISSARRWPRPISARPSTSMPAATT